MRLKKGMSKNNNRNKIVQWSITFPTVERSPDSLMVSCGKREFAHMLPPYDYCIVCVEQHGDHITPEGGMASWHFHCGIKLKKGLTFVKMLNYIKEKFEHDYQRIKIEPVKNMQNWIDYCKKEDPYPFEWEADKPEKTPAARREAMKDLWPDVFGDFDAFMQECANEDLLKEKATEMAINDFRKFEWIIGGTQDEYIKANIDDYLNYIKDNS